MAMLGDVLALARSSSADFAAWLGEHDPATLREIEHAAGARGESVPEFTRAAVADYSRLASEDDWAGMMSRLRDSDDPGLTCLSAMVRWRLAGTTAAE